MVDGQADLVGRVLMEWVEEKVAQVHFGPGPTFESRRLGQVVRSRIDFIVIN